jgi:predicted nucleic acid-binding Zn ribbon protein
MEAADSSETFVIISARIHGVVCFALKMKEECPSDKIYLVFEYARRRSQKAVCFTNLINM